ncbi:hypothetical protein Poli38472_002207 [Pythium oligandrum]|uniref:Uncharacterized protein n=1 Tax=Pythium oligandrum TaxID=41045 RepID=A0A8K1CI95_PYTOL|nr:hypothetical protein Poli38472_002207 [Pythium oligandrum]|eukprot:TMW63266.1 hypothetical protein Poli38472_002207 [Pythium oligandrum]
MAPLLPTTQRDRAASTGQRRRKKRKKKSSHRAHRGYGLPNANQILMAAIVTGMLFYQLLRPTWLEFPRADATAGLNGFRVNGVNGTATSVSWAEFCNPRDQNFTLPIDDTRSRQLELSDAKFLCDDAVPTRVQALTAASITLAILSLIIALFLHLGSPTQRQIVCLGLLPGITLLGVAVMGTTLLILWQTHFAGFNYGECFGVAIAETAVAYLSAVSMAIRWRWPGVCAVQNEQQAFEAQTQRHVPPPVAAVIANVGITSTPAVTTPPQSPRPQANFRQFV